MNDGDISVAPNKYKGWHFNNTHRKHVLECITNSSEDDPKIETWFFWILGE